MPINDRLTAISIVFNEMLKCYLDLKAGKTSLGGPFLGLMDWGEELHYLLHDPNHTVTPGFLHRV